MQPSSSSNQLQPTPVTSLNKLDGSSVTSDSVPLITPSTPSPLSTDASDGGDDLSSVSVLRSTTSGSTMYQDTSKERGEREREGGRGGRGREGG